MRDDWYCHQFGSELGPLPFDMVVEMAQTGQLTPDDLIRNGANGEWVPGGTIVGLFSDHQNGETSGASSEQTLEEDADVVRELSDLEFTFVDSRTPVPATKAQSASHANAAAPMTQRPPAMRAAGPAVAPHADRDFEIDEAMMRAPARVGAPVVRSMPAPVSPGAPPAMAPRPAASAPSPVRRVGEASAPPARPAPPPRPVQPPMQPQANMPWAGAPQGTAPHGAAPQGTQLSQLLESASFVDDDFASMPWSGAVQGYANAPPAAPPPSVPRQWAPSPVATGPLVPSAAPPSLVAPSPVAPSPRAVEPPPPAPAAAPPVKYLDKELGLTDDDDEDDEDDDDDDPDRPRRRKKKKREDRWYCRLDGEEHGPIPFRQLKMTAAAGRLTATDVVRRGPKGEWVPAGAIRALFEADDDSRMKIDFDRIASSSGPAAEPSRPEPANPAAEAAKPAAHVDSLIRGALLNAVTAPRQVETRDRTDPTQLLRNPKVWMAVGVLVAGLVIWAGVKSSMRSAAERAWYKDFAATYDEMKELRKHKASKNDWFKFSKEVLDQYSAVLKDMNSQQPKNGSAAYELLVAGRDHIVPMTKDSQMAEGPHERQFAGRLKRAEAILEGKDPPKMPADETKVEAN